MNGDIRIKLKSTKTLSGSIKRPYKNYKFRNQISRRVLKENGILLKNLLINPCRVTIKNYCINIFNKKKRMIS